MARLQKRSGNIEFFSNVKFIGFDFDNTLIDEQYSIRRRWQKVLYEYRFLSKELAKKFFEIYERKGPNYKLHLDDAILELGIDKKFKEKILSKFRKTFEEEKLLDSAKDLLEVIKEKKIKMVVITDGKQSYQEGRIKKAGIYNYFDFIVYGNGKKEKKPTKRILQILKKHLGKTTKFPEEFLYIGDNFENDIDGFAKLGAKTYLVNKKNNLKRLYKLLNTI